MPRFHVSRSIEIEVTPEKAFETIADFGTWTTWSPWLCGEPDATVNVTADRSSVGSIYAWSGEVVGAGEIEHRELQPGRLIDDELRFLKPFRSQSDVRFDFEPQGNGTRVTWRMDGALPWFLFWMRPQMEGFIAMDYDRGLKMLKEWLETGQILSKTVVQGVQEIQPLQMAGVRMTSAMKDLGPAMEKAFGEAHAKLSAAGLPTDGEGISVYHKFDMRKRTFDFTSGFVLPESAEALPDGLATWSTPATRALRVDHIGSYDNLGNAWSAAHQHARYKKLKLARRSDFELYKNRPEDTAAADLLTEIYLPLR